MDTIPGAHAGAQQWRFSLRNLLIVLGGACLLLAPVHWFGIVYLVSAVLSLVLVLVCSLAYLRSASGSIFYAALGLFFGFFLSIGFMLFSLHSLLNLFVCAVLASAKRPPRVYAACLTALMIAIYGIAILGGASKVRELTVLKAQYPLESLAGRLAFEEHHPESTQTSPIQLATAVTNRLDELDEEYGRNSFPHAWALERLHENTAAEFARAAGFGYSRMPALRSQFVQLKPRKRIKMPVPIAIMPLDPAFSLLESTHQAAIRSFIDLERMGYVRSRDEVAGFESHGLSPWRNDERSPETPNWQIIRLELVSLLRHAEPRVYVAETMPEMDKLANVPNRPLNSFEQSALPQLITQKDTVVDQQPDRTQMLGALRAGKTCLECHHGDRGKLLGAFSYELVPLNSHDDKPAPSAAAFQASN